MDVLHRPEDKSFVSELISIPEFLQQGLEAGSNLFDYDPENMEEDMAKQMGTTPPVLNELVRVCNPEGLKCGFEDDDDPLRDYFPETSLSTIKVQKGECKKRETLTYRQMVNATLKYRRYNFRVIDHSKKLASPLSMEMKGAYEPEDVVMSVFLLKPYNRPLEYHELRLGRLLSMDSVFMVRGQTTMTALRDRIQCLSDFASNSDFSEDPDNQDRPFSKDIYPSASFFINNCFYNDMRKPEAIDMSLTVREWAGKTRGEIDGSLFSSAKMEESVFGDLQLRLGQPYLYLHQGHCEHVMFFTDLRLMHIEDRQELDAYPLLISTKIKKRTACFACKRYTAKWVVYGNERLPYDIAFFCDECFKNFHYDDDGGKIGDFIATPYIDRSALP